MNVLAKLLFFCLIPFVSMAQQGIILHVPAPPNTDPELLHFSYTPPAGLQLPADARVKVIYMPTMQKKAILEKTDGSLGFKMTLPDTAKVLLAAILDANSKVIDNNGGKGYAIELQKNEPSNPAANKVAFLQLAYFGNFSLELKNKPEDIIKSYENLYVTHPELKEEESFFDYARLKNQEDPEEGRQVLLAFANQNENMDKEHPMFYAMIAYNILKMEEEAKLQKEKILKKFPKGELAKGEFNGRLYDLDPKTEENILALMHEYEALFKDTSAESKSPFYIEILRVLIPMHDWGKLDKYEKLLTEPLLATSIYNSYVWDMSGGDLTSPGMNLKEAEMIGARALRIAKERLKNPTPADDIDNLQGNYNNLKDTYALILYKLGRYPEAFAQQHYVDSLGGLDAGGKERMAAYTEKAKGAEYARTYIEKTLAEGTYSLLLLKQLEELYRQLNLPMDNYAAIKEKTDSLGKARAKEAIMAMFGTDNAIDFTLPDAAGKQVSLFGLRGKMVVLDFWATWCGPCLASFPKMQELVEKYDGNKAAFLFINTWENSKLEVTKEKVDKLLKEKKYSFNVLFDSKDEVVKKYKIEGIPTKIVIDKEGKIVSIDSSEESLVALIEGRMGN